MTTSTSKSSYADCFDLFDRAIESLHGIRAPATSPGNAHQLYTRLHYARTLARAESMSIYASDAPEYGISPYDALIVRRPRERDGKWWVYIEPRVVQEGVEELGAAE